MTHVGFQPNTPRDAGEAERLARLLGRRKRARRVFWSYLPFMVVVLAVSRIVGQDWLVWVGYAGFVIAWFTTSVQVMAERCPRCGHSNLRGGFFGGRAKECPACGFALVAPRPPAP